jgi:RHS repeat-associated protein
VTSIVDSTGTVQERYTYTAYGQPGYLSASFSSQASSAFGWETLYSGYRWDSIVFYYLARRRWLDWLTGRWLSRDAVDHPGGENLYLYCGSGPLACVDPSGLAPPKTKPPKTKTQRTTPPPAPKCRIQLCCALIFYNGFKVPCKKGEDRYPCHCFIVFTETNSNPGEKPTNTDTQYHGYRGNEAFPACNNDNKLECDNKLPIELTLGTPTCGDLGLGDKTCDEMKNCLDDEVDSCNKKGRCYGYCPGPNSNTAAYEFASCATGVPEKPNTKRTGCNTKDKTPGWGPEKK